MTAATPALPAQPAGASDIFPRLYALLDRNLLHTKYRSRFFRLLDTFDQTHSTLESATNEIAKRFGELEAKLGSFLVDKKTPTAVHINELVFRGKVQAPQCHVSDREEVRRSRSEGQG